MHASSPLSRVALFLTASYCANFAHGCACIEARVADEKPLDGLLDAIDKHLTNEGGIEPWSYGTWKRYQKPPSADWFKSIFRNIDERVSKELS